MLSARLLTALLLATSLIAWLAALLTSLLLPALLSAGLLALALLTRLLPRLLAALPTLIARAAQLLDLPPHPFRLTQRLLHGNLTLVVARIAATRLAGF